MGEGGRRCVVCGSDVLCICKCIVWWGGGVFDAAYDGGDVCCVLYTLGFGNVLHALDTADSSEFYCFLLLLCSNNVVLCTLCTKVW